MGEADAHEARPEERGERAVELAEQGGVGRGLPGMGVEAAERHGVDASRDVGLDQPGHRVELACEGAVVARSVGAAILAADGSALAASARADRWAEDAGALLEVADRAGGEPVEHVHIATEQGEVFALRHAGLTAVVVADRFALTSVLFFDMRSVLRDLAAA